LGFALALALLFGNLFRKPVRQIERLFFKRFRARVFRAVPDDFRLQQRL